MSIITGASITNPQDYVKMWVGAGVIGSLANGISRVVGDYLYTEKGWPMVGAFIDNYFMLPQTGLEIVLTSYLTMLAVNYLPNLGRASST